MRFGGRLSTRGGVNFAWDILVKPIPPMMLANRSNVTNLKDHSLRANFLRVKLLPSLNDIDHHGGSGGEGDLGATQDTFE